MSDDLSRIIDILEDVQDGRSVTGAADEIEDMLVGRTADAQERWLVLLSLVETYGEVTLRHEPNGGRNARGDRVPFNVISVGTELRNSGFKHFNQGLDDTVETLRKIKDHDTTK